ncbi:MAG: RAMP superfamily CRISPR-associated protein [Candidatus Helarchaeota archaeon]
MDYRDYIWVDSSRRSFIPRNILTFRNNYNNIYKIQLHFKVVSPVHVGNGDKDIDSSTNNLILKIYNYNGIPRIPGSSFKGFVSTFFLGLSANPILTAELFGTTKKDAVISKTFFNDLLIDDKNLTKRSQLVKVDRMFRPKERRRNHLKFYVGRAKKTSFHGMMETIPIDTILSTNIVGINLKDFEIGGILMSCGLFLNSQNMLDSKIFKIGYAKPQCFGKIKLEPNKIKIFKYSLNILDLNKTQVNNISYFLDQFSKKINSTLKRDSVFDRFNKLFKDDCR